MAIVMRMRWDGVTPDQYEQVRAITGFETNPAPGGILHEAWFVGDQLNVCDVWETADDFNAFVQDRLMPAVAQIGATGQPEVEIRPAYNWQVEKGDRSAAVIDEDENPAEAYQALEAKVGWRDVPPVGGISHIATIEGGVARSVSVWESAAALEAFATDRIGPAAVALGFPPPEENGALHPLHLLFDARHPG